MTIKKSNRINVKNLVFAVMVNDDSTDTEYGEIASFAKAMQLQLSPEVSTGDLYGDGVKQESIAKLTGISVVADVNKVPIDVRAKINGNTYENGVLIEKEGDEAPYIALGYEVEQTNKTSEYIWLLKGKAQPYASTVQQTTESINFSTDSITINFMPRESDGEIRKFGDSAADDFTKEMAEAWFKEVGGGTPEGIEEPEP